MESWYYIWNMTYREFVDQLNAGMFSKVVFSIDGYGHYRNCTFLYEGNPKKKFLISLLLTKDGSERMYFHGFFNEGEKVFRIKGEGNLTLERAWKRVVIQEIVYR